MCLLGLRLGHIRSTQPLCSATFSTLQTTRSFVAGQRFSLTGEVESVQHEEGISKFLLFELSQRSLPWICQSKSEEENMRKNEFTPYRLFCCITDSESYWASLDGVYAYCMRLLHALIASRRFAR